MPPTTPPGDIPANERAAWEARIRADEQERAKASQLAGAVAALQGQVSSAHGEVMAKLDHLAGDIINTRGRLELLERDQQERAKRGAYIEQHLRLSEWGADDLENLLPSVQQYGGKLTGRSKWKERLAIGATACAFLTIALNIYVTLRGK